MCVCVCECVCVCKCVCVCVFEELAEAETPSGGETHLFPHSVTVFVLLFFVPKGVVCPPLGPSCPTFRCVRGPTLKATVPGAIPQSVPPSNVSALLTSGRNNESENGPTGTRSDDQGGKMHMCTFIYHG